MTRESTTLIQRLSFSKTVTWKSFACSVVLVCATTPFVQAQSESQVANVSRIPGSIVGNRMQVVGGHHNRLADAKNDIGMVDQSMPMSRMVLSLKPTAAQQSDLDQLLKDIQDPNSPSFHKWLTPEQYADRFGQNPGDIQKITDWLTAKGFTIIETARGRNWIAFSGTAQQVQQTFNTPIHHYVVNGVKHFANAKDPSVPVEIAEMVNAVHGLHDFKPHHNMRKPIANRLKNSARPNLTLGDCSSNNCYTVLAPDDIATIYNIKQLTSSNSTLCGGSPCNGTGQSIVVAGQSDILLTDIQAFQSLFSLPQTTIPTQTIYVPGGGAPGVIPGDSDESSLDLEWSSSTARNANIIFVTSNTGGGAFDSVTYAIDQDFAPVISLSYSQCEYFLFPADFTTFEQEAQKANVEGITILSASGDSGTAACDDQNEEAAQFGNFVNYPASSPEVTGVGGTFLNDANSSFNTYWNTSNTPTLASVISYIPEEAWNDTFIFWDNYNDATLASSGGGPSNCVGQDLVQNTCLYGFPKPSWQTGPGVPADGVRDVPDVALASSSFNDPYIYCSQGYCPTSAANYSLLDTNYQFTQAGGTSFATPVFAGIVAILNQYLSSNHLAPAKGLGNINPVMYQMAVTQNGNPNGPFHDIVANANSDFEDDNNSVNCEVGSSTQCGAATAESTPFGYLAGYNTGVGYDQVTGLGSVNAYNFVVSFMGTAASVTPNTISYSVLKGLSSSPIEVVYQNNTSSNITLSNVSVSPGNFALTQTCTSSPIPSHGSCAAFVSFAPNAISTVPGTLTFTDAANTNTLSVSLTGVGYDVTITNTRPVRGHATTSSTISGPGQSTTFDLSMQMIAPSNGSVGTVPTVTFDCSNLPAATTCKVSPGSLQLNASSTNFTVEITANETNRSKRLHSNASSAKQATAAGNYMATLTAHIGAATRTFYLPFTVN